MVFQEKLKGSILFNTKDVSDSEELSETEKFGNKLAEIEEYNEQYPEPTAEQYHTLQKIIGRAPYVSYLICLIELAERASYYGVTGRFGNFIQLPLPEGGNGAGAPPKGTQKNAGALGLGLQTASALTLLITFLAYLTPLVGGYLADKKWGRIKTIWWGVWLGALSHVFLVIAAIPSVITHGKSALAPTILGIVFLAFGTGFIKPNLLPLLYDQYPHKRDIVKTEDSGKQVIVSKNSTYERMTLFFYWSINVGAFFSVATSYCAKDVGFWLAYLLPCIVYMAMVPLLLVLKPKLKHEKPSGYSLLAETFKVLLYSFKKGWYGRIREGKFWEYAKPTNIATTNPHLLEVVKKSGERKISWNDQFVNDVKITFESCSFFLFYVIYLINDGGIGSIQNSQSNAMTTNGVPNDLISNFNPLTIIVFIPFLNFVFYPLLRKFGINFRPVYRIFTGFMLASLSSVAGAIIQWKVYETSPCGYYASDCAVGSGVSPISVWVEVVLYVLQAASECFTMTAGYEVAYGRAPEHMKGLVMAIFLFMSSLSAAVSEACTASLVDPHLVWPFVGTAVAGVFFGVVFLWLYKDLHITMERERAEREQILQDEITQKIQHYNDGQAEDKKIGIQAIKSIVSHEIQERLEDKEVLSLKAAETVNILNK